MANIRDNVIMLTDLERRDWVKSTRTIRTERRKNPRDVTRRFLLFTHNQEVRRIMEKEFFIIPHISGINSFFLCIAPGRYRRTRKFAMGIIDKLMQNGLEEDQIKSFEIFTPDKKLSMDILRRLKLED